MIGTILYLKIYTMTGKEVKKKIKEKGFKYVDIARKMGVSHQNLCMLLREEAPVSTTTLERVAEAMGESVSYFYNELPILSVEDYAEVVNKDKEIEYLRALVRNYEIVVAKVKNRTL